MCIWIKELGKPVFQTACGDSRGGCGKDDAFVCIGLEEYKLEASVTKFKRPSENFFSDGLLKKITRRTNQRVLNFGGGGEIRTHGGLSTLDGFQDRCIKPLCHTSGFIVFQDWRKR